jgi:hypothetical protein
MWRKHWLLIIPFLTSLIFGLYQINASGETWDENYRYQSGRKYISNWLDLDFSYDSWGWQFEHPPIGRYPYGVAAIFTERLFPHDPSYMTNNLTFARSLSVLQTSVTAVFIYLIGRLLFSSQIGLLAGVIYSLLPNTLAVSRLVSHEAPMTMYFTICIYFFFKALKQSGNSKNYLWSGIFLGLALGSRFNNWLLLLLLPILYGLFNWKTLWRKSEIRLPANLILLFPIGLLVFFITWPWLWGAPFDRFIQSLNFWREQGKGATNHSYFYYLQFYLVTTPVVVLALHLVYVLRLLKEKNKWLLALLFWFLTPYLFSLARYQQGGFHYVASSLAPMSLMAALGAEWLAQLTVKRWRRIQSVWIPGALTILILVFIDAHFFPYYLDYYNVTVGGPVGAFKKGFPVGNWGNGAKEAVDYVNRTAPTSATVTLAVQPELAAPPLRGDLTKISQIRPEINLPIDLLPGKGKDFYTDIPPPEKRGDYLIVYWTPLIIPDFYEKIYESTVDGYSLAQVYKLKKPS